MIKVATVCSGIGSPEQALKELGIPHEISFACEIDKYARQTYLANFKPKLMLSDMTKETWEGEDFYSDLFIGGIPCQSFSLAGKRLGELDPRGLLFYDFYRYIKNQQPRYFIIENVKGLLSDDKGRTFRNWIQLLGRSENTHVNMFNHPDSLEYNLHWTVLNTKDFGLPQNRERVFLVGIRKDLPNTFRFPAGWWLDKRLKDVLEINVDEKYYLSEKMMEGLVSFVDIKGSVPEISLGGYVNQFTQASKVYRTSGVFPTLTSGNNGYNLGYIEEPVVIQLNNSKESGGKQPYQQNRIYSIDGIMTALDTECGRKNIAEPKLTQVFQLDGFESEGRIYDSEGISRTIRNGGGGGAKTGWYLVGNTPYRVRRLTPLECFRLQGFPDSFIKPCSDTQTYKQAGNTISVPVIQEIIKNILN